MEIECKILGIESKSTKTGKQMWTVKTDKGNMNVFDSLIVDKITPYINGMVTLEVEEKGTFKNIKGVAGTKSPHENSVVVKQALNTTTMYTSYAKDVFIALYSRYDLAEKDDMDVVHIMARAINIVKQAKEAFS